MGPSWKWKKGGTVLIELNKTMIEVVNGKIEKLMRGGKIGASYTYQQGKLIDFIYLPHPNYPVTKVARDKAWKFCFKKLNHLLFKANVENKKFKQLKLNYNLNLLYNSGLIDYLIKELNYPEAIILFGSFAKAENNSASDIDLLIISSSKKYVHKNK